MINIGIIGCGQWGPNHVRNFSHLPGSRALMCADLHEDRLRTMKQTFRNIRPTKNYKEILNHPQIDAVVISTPTGSHYKFVKEALKAGKHVLCEKPLCRDLKEAKELVTLAKKYKKVLMVGHVFLFNSGIKKMRDLVTKKKCGNIFYMHSERTNLGPFRSDVNAAWDLAAHDISIFNYILGDIPSEVSAVGGKYLQKKVDDVVFISLTYPNGTLCNVHVSWLDPKKVREITIVGSKKMLVWDDLDNEGPVKIYNKTVASQYYETFGEFHLLAKEGDITIPKIRLAEPLKAQDAYFLECIKKKKNGYISDGDFSVDVVRVLSAVDKSLALGGNRVKVPRK